MNIPRLSILALSSLLTSGLLLTGCGKASDVPAVLTSSPSVSSTASSLSTMPNGPFTREKMVELYTNARASVDESTPETYFTLVEEITHDPAKIEQFRTHWPEAETKQALKTFALPDLTKGTFLEFKQEGDWAGYYYLSDLEDTERVTISLVRLHQKDGRWMVYPRGGSSSVEAPPTEAERAMLIKETMEESDALRLKRE